MTGFEPRISGVGSDRFTNWDTTTALRYINLYDFISLTESYVNLLLMKAPIFSFASLNKTLYVAAFIYLLSSIYVPIYLHIYLYTYLHVYLYIFVFLFFTTNSLQLKPVRNQCDQKKSPNVYKSCPKMISLEKLKILTPLQELPKNVGDLGNVIVASGFKKLPKVQKIVQSGHTVRNSHCLIYSLGQGVKTNHLP